MAFFLYRRRRKLGRSRQIIRYQADGATFVPERPAVTPARRSRRVWRAEQSSNGVPAYTSQPATGELSLGIGRKQSAEDYEMVRVESMADVASRRESSGTALEWNEGGDDVERSPSPAPVVPIADPLPPYVPPPPSPAVVVTRVRSKDSESVRTVPGRPSNR